jgi:hypothetical protein
LLNHGLELPYSCASSFSLWASSAAWFAAFAAKHVNLFSLLKSQAQNLAQVLNIKTSTKNY